MKKRYNSIKMAIAVIMTIGSVTLLSCGKDETSSMRDQNRIYDAGSLSDNCISNKNTKIPEYFDRVGIKHNEYLDSIGVALRDTLLYYEKNGHTLAEFGKDTFDIVFDRVKSLYRTDINDVLNVNKYSFEYDIWAPTQEIIENDNLAFFENDFGRRLQSIIGNVDQTVSIDSIRAQIRAIEYSVILDASCLEDTAVAFALSIWEHSLDYWSKALVDTKNPWYGFLDDRNSPKDFGNLSSQKGLFSGFKAFVTNVVNTVRNIFKPQNNDTTVQSIVLCDMAAGAVMAYQGAPLLAIHWAVYGGAVVVSAAATSAASYFLNKNVL